MTSNFLGNVETLSWFTWFVVSAGVLTPVIHALHPIMRRSFYALQLDYRRTYGEMSLAEEIEFREYYLSGELPDVRPIKLLQDSLLGGAAASTGMWASDREPQFAPIVLVFASALLCSAAYSWWHKVNDPPSETADEGSMIMGGASDMPKEAWAGLVGGSLLAVVLGSFFLAL